VITSARALAAAIVLVVAPAGAGAQEPVRPEANGAVGDQNYTMVPAEGRHLKIDRRTGRVSVCDDKNGNWNCRLVADDREAYEDEIARLETENDELRRQLSETTSELAQRDQTDNWIGPEDEKKLDEFLTFSDKAIRRFFDMVQDLKRDLNEPDTL
jgi:hypothetical protein